LSPGVINGPPGVARTDKEPASADDFDAPNSIVPRTVVVPTAMNVRRSIRASIDIDLHNKQTPGGHGP
jgi:hypothetical protein